MNTLNDYIQALNTTASAIPKHEGLVNGAQGVGQFAPNIGTGNANTVFMFVASWLVIIALLTFINKSRVGHVLIYYSLVLFIILVLVTQYRHFVPLLNNQLVIQPVQG